MALQTPAMRDFYPTQDEWAAFLKTMYIIANTSSSHVLEFGEMVLLCTGKGV